MGWVLGEPAALQGRMFAPQLPFAALGVLLRSPLSGVVYKLLMGQDLDFLARSKDLSREVGRALVGVCSNFY